MLKSGVMFKIVLVLVFGLMGSVGSYGAEAVKEVKVGEGVSEVKKIKVLAWNIWGRMNEDPRYTVKGKTGRERVIEILKDTGAEIILMVETYGSAKDIAEGLGYHYYTASKNANLCIFSKYKLSDVGTPKGLSSFSFVSATVHVGEKKKMRLYGIWLTSGGMHTIAVTDKKVLDAVYTKDNDRRYKHFLQLMNHAEFKADLKNVKDVPLIMGGDFNNVSHLDYTKATKKAGLNFGRILPMKLSLAIEGLGFVDSYRVAHPVVTKETLGYTWTTVGQGYKYISNKGFVKLEGEVEHDPYREMFARIDYIYHAGKRLKVLSSEVLKRYKDVKGRGFVEFPSDHAGVLTEYEVK